MPVARTTIAGSPYLGVYLRVGERTALLPPSAPSALARDLERIFAVRVVRSTVGGADIVGALVAANSHGVVVGDEADEDEIAVLGRIAPVRTVAARLNALGNNILANDQGALVHPELPDGIVRSITAGLGVPVERGTLAGLGTVGMAGVATNRGAVVHPRTTPKEAELLASVLRVPVHRSTANFGVPIVGACLVANSRAMAVGRPTTPVEIVHLQEGLQIFD